MSSSSFAMLPWLRSCSSLISFHCRPHRVLLASSKSSPWLTRATSRPITSTSLRCLASKPRDESHWESAEKNAEIDCSSGDEAVYHGLLSTQIRLVKSFSLMTSALGLAAQPVFIWHAKTMENLALTLGFGFFLSLFTFATPLLVHHVSKKYVTELRYNQLTDTYTAVTWGLLLRKRQLEFRLKDVQVPSISSPFTTFRARNVPLFVDVENFRDPRHYGKIMGYDKPLNLRRRQ